ncbi:MAG: RNA recognition motif domain-containing protein [Phycisphaerales bacterium JB063]
MISIYVGNLPYDTTEAGLIELFSTFGEVHRASLVTDRETQRPRGFGFVEMPNREDAEKAIEALAGTEFNGRPLTVNEARRNTSRNTANLSRSAKAGTHEAEPTPQSHGSSGYAAKPKPQPSPRDDTAPADEQIDTDTDDTDETPASGYRNQMKPGG